MSAEAHVLNRIHTSTEITESEEDSESSTAMKDAELRKWVDNFAVKAVRTSVYADENHAKIREIARAKLEEIKESRTGAAEYARGRLQTILEFCSEKRQIAVNRICTHCRNRPAPTTYYFPLCRNVLANLADDQVLIIRLCQDCYDFYRWHVFHHKAAAIRTDPMPRR